MFQKIVFVLFVTLTYTLANNDERIIGGWVAVEGQFGHQVSIREKNTHFCGGSILDKWTILTAAHCLEGRILSDLMIVAGTSYLTIGGQVYDVSTKVVHHNYNKTTGENDLAILKLIVPIKFTKRMRVATLPKKPLTVHEYIQVVGWGWYRFPGNITEDLRYLHIKTMPLEECATLLEQKHSVTEKNICIKPSVGEGTCFGDYGNGMFDYSDYLIGMAMWSSTPCGAGNPDLFTNIYMYKDWIQGNMSSD